MRTIEQEISLLGFASSAH